VKTFIALFSLVLALGLMAGPAIAATHHMVGDVRTINQDAKTFTLEEHKTLRSNQEHTFRVDNPALFSQLRTGEHVRVAYDKEGKLMIARDVQPEVKK